MARRPAVVAAAVLAVALAAGTTSGTTSALEGPAPGPVGITAPSSTGEPTDPRHARTAYERRALEAERDSLDLEPVLGERDRPNILVLMADDVRDDDLRFMPHVQELIAGQGVRFANTFAPQPLCCPARATFLTGKHSHNHHVWSHKPPFGFQSLDDRRTLPVWLERLGYHTFFIGKYLNGYGRQQTFRGGPSVRYVPPGWSDWRGSIDNRQEALGHLSGGTYRFFDTTLNVNGRLEPHAGSYQTHVYSRIVQDVLRDQARSPEPLFAWVSFTAPHAGSPLEEDDPGPVTWPDGAEQIFPSTVRPDYVKGRFDGRLTQLPGWEQAADRIEEKPRFIRRRPPMSAQEQDSVLATYRQRAEALSVVDDEVANIMATLERTGELDNTYVLFTSDNGYFLGEHRMRLGKILPYEPSLRVPLVLRGPGIPPGEIRTDPFLMTDFAPTLVAAAHGGRPDGVDGQDMLPVAVDGDRGWVRGILTDSGPRAVGTDVTPRDGDQDRTVLRFSQGVRTGRYLYVEHANDERELYDLRRDPRQFDNVVHEPRMQHVVRLLAAELDRLRHCQEAECLRPLAPPLRTRNPVPAYVVSPVAPRRDLDALRSHQSHS